MKYIKDNIVYDEYRGILNADGKLVLGMTRAEILSLGYTPFLGNDLNDDGRTNDFCLRPYYIDFYSLYGETAALTQDVVLDTDLDDAITAYEDGRELVIRYWGELPEGSTDLKSVQESGEAKINAVYYFSSVEPGNLIFRSSFPVSMIDTARYTKSNYNCIALSTTTTPKVLHFLPSSDSYVSQVQVEELEELETTLLTDALRKSEQVLLPAEKTQVLTNLGIADVAKESNLKTVNGASIVGTGNIEVLSVNAGDIDVMQATGTSTTGVMSQKAVTEYGRKVTTEDLDGTSEWIKAQLTAEGWEFDKYVGTSGTTVTDNRYCATPYFELGHDVVGHKLIIYYNFDSNGSVCFTCYDENKTKKDYYTCNSNMSRTLNSLGSAFSGSFYFRITLNPSKLSKCYVYDVTTGTYIWRGDVYLKELSNDNNLTPGILKNEFIVQDIGDSETKTISQKTITNLLETNHIYKTHYSNFAVANGYNKAGVRSGKLISADTWDMRELKILSSLRLTDQYSGATINNYQHCHLLGIGTDLTDNYFSIYQEDYNWFIWFRKNGTNVLKYQIGDYRAYWRLFAVFDFYSKTICLYGWGNTTTGNEVLVDHYDFSSLDLSGFSDVHILSGFGAANHAMQYSNWIEINNFVFDWNEKLDKGKNMVFGSYNSLGSQSMVKDITAIPSSFKFTNESNTEGITVTLDDPYHKIVTVDRDTAALVYNVGFYNFNTSPSNYQFNVYEIFKVKFTNITSNVLLRGWVDVSGASYIIDKNYNYTRIPMSTNTGTVLSYEVVEGDTYYIMYPIGNGYATRYNHYFGGHFTMEITEPTIYSVGRQNLVCQSYNGTYFEGYFPFKGELYPTEAYGQFTTNTYPALTGRIRINNGNIQVYNGSAWKQINNS